MGSVVRAYRHHPFHGRVLSQELVAGWLGITQAQLSRIEHGPPIKDLDKLIYWAQLLGMPARYLWFKIPARESDVSSTPEAPPTWSPVKEADDVDRNEFLRLAGSSLVHLLSPPLLHGWSGQDSSPPIELSDDFLAQTCAQIEGFRWLDRRDGARRNLAATSRHARALIHYVQLSDNTHPLHIHLTELAANACHLVAYQAFDQGCRPQALEWYRSSAELAARVESQELYVFAICGVAYMHAKNGENELALSILRQLLGLPLSAAAACYVAVYEAHAYASGRQHDLAVRVLERAAKHAEQTGNEAPSSWLGISNGSFVERQRAMVLAQFGAMEALPLLEALEHSTPAVFRRYRVALSTDCALIHACHQQVEEAASLLVEAWTDNQQTRSVEKAWQMLKVREVLRPFEDSQAVKAVDQVMRATGMPS
jgi:transcriptional regulator with XRE-family HTH domain